MVEANGPEMTDSANQVIDFFDTIFNAVPPVYKQVDKEFLDSKDAA
jgi:hypothetical protein